MIDLGGSAPTKRVTACNLSRMAMPDFWDQLNVPTWDLLGNWDGDLRPALRKKIMIVQLSLNLTGMSDADLVKLVKNHEKAVTEHPEVFATPDPTAAVLAAAREGFELAMADQATAATAATEATRLKNASRLSLEDLMRTRDGYVTKLGRTNPSAPGLSNLPVRSTPGPVGLVAAPESLNATLGDLEHTVDLGWDKVRGARSYVVQWCADPMSDANWQQAGISTKSSYLVTGLTAGTKYWFRVAAVGAAGQGPWSDPCAKMAV